MSYDEFLPGCAMFDGPLVETTETHHHSLYCEVVARALDEEMEQPPRRRTVPQVLALEHSKELNVRYNDPTNMSLVDYFVHHYTLIIDNDQFMYESVKEAARDVVRASGITKPRWEALSKTNQEPDFTIPIGTTVMELLEEWCEDALDAQESPGHSLIKEIMIFSDSNIAHRLGTYYLPENADIIDLLPFD